MNLNFGPVLEGVQRSLSDGGPSHLLILEEKLKVEMENVLAHEEFLWLQKSRQSALRDGDRNTRYFHLDTAAYRKMNRIIYLYAGGFGVSIKRLLSKWLRILTLVISRTRPV